MPVKSKTVEYVTLAVPKGQLLRIKAAAKKDYRPISNWVWQIVKKELDRAEKK